jgi:SAM-dependent methyltransferase
MLYLLKKKNIYGVGLDISEVAVNKCAAKGVEARKYDFVNKQLPYNNNSFEYVLLLDVLEHLYDPLNLLLEAKRVASQYIIISVPNFNALPSRLQMLRGGIPENNKHRQGHIYWFNYKILEGMIIETGLFIGEIRINTFWENKKIIRFFTRNLSVLFPDLFGLSYVVKAKK